MYIVTYKNNSTLTLEWEDTSIQNNNIIIIFYIAHLSVLNPDVGP